MNRFLGVLAGALAGILSYAVIAPLHSSWWEIVGALLIGLVPGLVQRSARRALLGSAACAAGWLLGAVAFGIWMDLGMGAWLLAGAFLGAAAGVFSFSVPRAIAGAALGLLAGLLGEISRYATLAVHGLRTADMQLLLLVSAGVLLNAAAALVMRRAARRAP